MKHVFVVSALAAALAACGSKSKSETTTDTGTTSGVALTAENWASMDLDTRAKYMDEVVVPTMAPLFSGFDAQEFAKVDCATCHGEGAQTGDFEMPSPSLDALSPEMIMNPDEDHKAITEFMMAQIKPTMAKLLGKPEYTPETPDGFGCFGCHPMAQ